MSERHQNMTHAGMFGNVYYDGKGKAWILERTWLREKLVSERWIRARKYDSKD